MTRAAPAKDRNEKQNQVDGTPCQYDMPFTEHTQSAVEQFAQSNVNVVGQQPSAKDQWTTLRSQTLATEEIVSPR